MRRLSTATIGLLLVAGAARADDGIRVYSPDIDARVLMAVDKGLAYLAKTQNPDGSWTCKIGYKLNESFMGEAGENVAATALAGMAFLAGGSVPGRGRYGEAAAKALDFILSCSRPEDGYITHQGSRMYEHAFATLFLAESYGTAPREDVKRKLKEAVNLLIRCQNAEGGWRYQPTPIDADISVTVTVLQGLRAARNVGIKVPRTTIEKAMRYVKECGARSYDGAFRYQMDPRFGTRSTFALTAAGITSLYSAGEYDAPEIEQGLEFLRNHRHELRYHAYHFFYGHYYGAQAMYQAGGSYWRDYFSVVRDEILANQTAGGDHWADDVGESYATAMACIILQIPNNYLPIMQK